MYNRVEIILLQRLENLFEPQLCFDLILQRSGWLAFVAPNFQSAPDSLQLVSYS
jgi:hypothetical protein